MWPVIQETVITATVTMGNTTHLTHGRYTIDSPVGLGVFGDATHDADDAYYCDRYSAEGVWQHFDLCVCVRERERACA